MASPTRFEFARQLCYDSLLYRTGVYPVYAFVRIRCPNTVLADEFVAQICSVHGAVNQTQPEFVLEHAKLLAFELPTGSTIVQQAFANFLKSKGVQDPNVYKRS